MASVRIAALGAIGVRTGRVLTEGDELHYEVRGDGPPLLMISGGGGDAGFYEVVATVLSGQYQVITYDRRGNSRSTRNNPQNFEISQQSRDAVAVLRANGHASALMFGNSGGAVILLDLAKTHPQSIILGVVHEAPVVRVLPDAAKWSRFFANCYATAHRFGSHAAMARVALSTRLPWKSLKAVPSDLAKRMAGNHDFFVMHEMIPFSGYKPDVRKIQENEVRLIIAAGAFTLRKNLYYGRASPILAEQLGRPMSVLPGNHISYLDQPLAWATALRELLGTRQLAPNEGG
ncbi:MULTISPECIES: alpha/beta hydrolase [unclassified Bradyrhizobium]|uniref:alpha/beta fold hydrolase n=1 Tax=unclassified Bradyrhizobium TaxID=2631580 RepID=UPI001FFAF4DC|nr:MULTISPECIES: alpha/beta hydrolase [unclassified Bradyrhizobium]MCK1267588.1 alpha/beta hydrolase [Bradyrhizobium sp. 84]MCK1374322.1 alpha/beta hydrolase [Bradyrhizobium sp. 49]MCK1413745.1 alpha/beta hydrolase [Bradyrhizobium sp. CW4]MCK1427231.1 alpha/beta hydrolase [Bradyrhizobium sp. 87]